MDVEMLFYKHRMAQWTVLPTITKQRVVLGYKRSSSEYLYIQIVATSFYGIS